MQVGPTQSASPSSVSCVRRRIDAHLKVAVLNMFVNSPRHSRLSRQHLQNPGLSDGFETVCFGLKNSHEPVHNHEANGSKYHATSQNEAHTATIQHAQDHQKI